MSQRALLVGLLVAFALLQHQLWVTPQGMREVFRLNGALADLRAENDDLRRRNALLDAEVSDLRDGLGAIEERARSDLGMIRDNETFFRAPSRDLRVGLRSSSATP
ncbi:MAG: septum formation initiator family protein [Pseudomonadota bacterium]